MYNSSDGDRKWEKGRKEDDVESVVYMGESDSCANNHN